MKFCLLIAQPNQPEDEKVYTVEQNHVNCWASFLGGRVYNLPPVGEESGDPDYDFFDQFDLVMIALRQEAIEVGIEIKQKTKAKVVAFLDAEVDHYTTYITRDIQARLVELLNIVDAVAVLHDESIPLFKALTSKPVGLVGVPFPLQKVRELCPPVQKRQEIELGSIIEASALRNRDGLVNLVALSEIGMTCVVDMRNPAEMDYLWSIRTYLKLPQIKFRDNNPDWEHYLTQASYSLLGLHLDYRYTWGSFPLECAAVRMPCVAPSCLYTQKHLFPELCVPYNDIPGVVALVKKLVNDVKFYEQALAYAEEQLDFFSGEKTFHRLLNLIS
ncbi:hypothetical protein [Desulfoscipio gibsoniae]|uniref:Glycosyltransferase n=1 Tax=Desulfoscipio gibsoniae DSM 7213 TaxID=767817 RepID=R4KQB8_9FIRM|nr:hypothetical protein [Desulfoscipio gibsoniae]AGL02775.1 hypothetical protein Desgi_3432 [Desulfoscipio gibsoniae DSM 7213]